MEEIKFNRQDAIEALTETEREILNKLIEKIDEHVENKEKNLKIGKTIALIEALSKSPSSPFTQRIAMENASVATIIALNTLGGQDIFGKQTFVKEGE